MKTVLKGVALGFMAVPLLAGVALAGGPEHVEGNCGNQAELVEGGNIRTVEGDGSTISLRYTNGLGIANNVKLRISPISEEKGAFADTTVVGPETGGTWTLAKDVLNGTKFHLNYRSAEKVQVDDHGDGELAWSMPSGSPRQGIALSIYSSLLRVAGPCS